MPPKPKILSGYALESLVSFHAVVSWIHQKVYFGTRGSNRYKLTDKIYVQVKDNLPVVIIDLNTNKAYGLKYDSLATELTELEVAKVSGSLKMYFDATNLVFDAIKSTYPAVYTTIIVQDPKGCEKVLEQEINLFSL